MNTFVVVATPSSTVCPLRSPRWPVVFGEFGHYGDGCLGKEGDLEGQERIHLRHTIAMPHDAICIHVGGGSDSGMFFLVLRQDLMRNWSIAFAGNMIGCLLIGVLANYTGILTGGASEMIVSTTMRKLGVRSVRR